MNDALTLMCVPSVLYCSEPSEGSTMVGGAHSLSNAKFLCSPPWPSPNSECFSHGRIIATSICVNRIMEWRFSKSIEKTSSVHVWKVGLYQKHRNFNNAICSPH